jgi:hypothetical protein
LCLQLDLEDPDAGPIVQPRSASHDDVSFVF